MNTEVRIDIYDEFNLIDVMKKCPYNNDEDAISDLKRCLVYCQSVPPIYMIKSYDAMNEHSKVSYTNETIASQILKKIVIHKKTVERRKDYTAWDLFLGNQLVFTVKGLKFYSKDPQVFSYFRGYDYKKLNGVKRELIQPFLNHIHDVIADGNDEVYKYILIF